MPEDVVVQPYEEDTEPEKCLCCGEVSDDIEDGLCYDCREAMKEEDKNA